MSLVSMQPTRLNTKDPLSQTPTNPYTLELHLAIKEVLPSNTPASSDPSLKVIVSGSREPTDNMEEFKVHGKEFLNIGFQCLQPVSSSFSTKRANFQYFPVIFSIFTHFCEF